MFDLIQTQVTQEHQTIWAQVVLTTCARLPGAAWKSRVVDLTNVLPKEVGSLLKTKTTQHIKIIENTLRIMRYSPLEHDLWISWDACKASKAFKAKISAGCIEY